jgi:hypothetical protein
MEEGPWATIGAGKERRKRMEREIERFFTTHAPLSDLSTY